MSKRYNHAWINVQRMCRNCGDIFYPHKDSHYVYIICKPCFETTPMMPYEGDHTTGGKDRRASLRYNGQEGNDYFG